MRLDFCAQIQKNPSVPSRNMEGFFLYKGCSKNSDKAPINSSVFLEPPIIKTDNEIMKSSELL